MHFNYLPLRGIFHSHLPWNYWLEINLSPSTSCTRIYFHRLNDLLCPYRRLPLLQSPVLILRRKITVIHAVQSATLVPEIQHKSIKFASNSLSLANTVFPPINRGGCRAIAKFRIGFQSVVTTDLHAPWFFWRRISARAELGEFYSKLKMTNNAPSKIIYYILYFVSKIW